MVNGAPGCEDFSVQVPFGSVAWYTLAGSGSRFEYLRVRLARLSALSAALAVILYAVVTKRVPLGCGQVARGMMSTVIVVLPAARERPGRTPMTIGTSSV